MPNEAALEDLVRRFEALGVQHVAVREPDAPWNGALCAVGLAPIVDRSWVRPLLSSLPLLGKPKEAARAA